MRALIGASCLVKACHVCKSMVHACAQPLFIYLFICFDIFTVTVNVQEQLKASILTKPIHPSRLS